MDFVRIVSFVAFDIGDCGFSLFALSCWCCLEFGVWVYGV